MYIASSVTAGSEGSVTFDGLEPNRRSWYTLRITGSLPNGNVVILKRRFHVGKQHNIICNKHAIYKAHKMLN